MAVEQEQDRLLCRWCERLLPRWGRWLYIGPDRFCNECIEKLRQG